VAEPAAAAAAGVGAGPLGAVAAVADAVGVGAEILGAAAEAGLDSVAVEPGWESHSSAGAAVVVDAAEAVGPGLVVAV